MYGAMVGLGELKLNFLDPLLAQNEANPNHRSTGCIWGQPGLGKTSFIKQYADEGYNIVDIPIAQLEEMGDFHGLPVTQKLDDGRTITSAAIPKWVPVKEEKGILLLDDFNRSDIRIVKGLMQLMQDYRTVNWQLPPKWTIMLTANPDNDDSQFAVTSLDSAMLTRLKHIQVKFEPNVWAQWAEREGLDRRGISFLLKYPEMASSEQYERTNPRTWADFFRVLPQFPEGKDGKNNKEQKATMRRLSIQAEACVDKEAATLFITFLKQDLDLVIEPDIVLDNPKETNERLTKLGTAKRTDMISVSCERLFARLINPTFSMNTKQMENLRAFMNSNLLDEFNCRDLRYSFLQRIVNSKKREVFTKLFDKQLTQRIAELIDIEE